MNVCAEARRVTLKYLVLSGKPPRGEVMKPVGQRAGRGYAPCGAHARCQQDHGPCVGGEFACRGTYPF